MGNHMTPEEARRHEEDLRQMFSDAGISFHPSEKPGMILMRVDMAKAEAFEGRAR